MNNRFLETDAGGPLNQEHSKPFSSGSRSDVTVKGIASAVGAFGLWAFFPIYFNQLDPGVSPWEIIIHRVIWALAVLSGFTLISRRMNRVFVLIKRPKVLLALAGSALAVGGNWATFIWAVTHEEILQSSLAYFINPLLSVFLGYCFLGERLHPLQRLAVTVALAGVLIAVLGGGQIPWLALMMAGFFGLYGLIRKQVDVDSVTGLMMETLFLLPPAIAWMVVMAAQGKTVFLKAGLNTDLLLIGGGVITILPLLLFVAAARRLKLATVGLLQYIVPTCHFLIGVFLYGEPFTFADAVTFGCIWTGLALYTSDMFIVYRTTRRAVS